MESLVRWRCFRTFLLPSSDPTMYLIEPPTYAYYRDVSSSRLGMGRVRLRSRWVNEKCYDNGHVGSIRLQDGSENRQP